MPKVSVIIPVYNAGQYLERCLDSIVNQTLKDIEIICVNDCSTDNSLAVIQMYAQKDKRIVIIDLPQNNGAAYAKNKGLEAAQGLYAGFVDSDDCVDLNFYEELYKSAIATDADILKGDLVIVEQDGTQKHSNLNNLIKNKSKFYFSFEYTSAIYKLSVVTNNNIKFPVDLIVGEDIVFQNRVLIKSKKTDITDNVKYYYIKRANSLNSDKYNENQMYSAIKAVEYIAENYNKALNEEISEDMYMSLYLANMFSLMDFTVSKTDDKYLKNKCAEAFIKLYNRCKLPNKIEEFMLSKYKKIFHFIQNNDYHNLTEICLQYKNLHNYCTIDRVRKNVNKDMKNAKSICNNSCL